MGSNDIFKPLSVHCAAQSINSSNIKNTIFGNAENQTGGSWVRSKNATSVLCSPPGTRLLISALLSMEFVSCHPHPPMPITGLHKTSFFLNLMIVSLQNLADVGSIFDLVLILGLQFHVSNMVYLQSLTDV